MKIELPFMPINWNNYINVERGSFYVANTIKQKEKNVVFLALGGKKWTGSYPISIHFFPHFKNKRADLDNFRIKGVLDGLVSAEFIKDDNLNYIQEILITPVFDKEDKLEIEIHEIKEDTQK